MKAIEWLGDRLKILDQTKLPREEAYIELGSLEEIASAITELKIRGAPALGIGVAYAVALVALKMEIKPRRDFMKGLDITLEKLAATRPTARNLFHVIERMRRVAASQADASGIKQVLVDEAKRIEAEEIEATKLISTIGADLIDDGATVLTHCNTGPLATGGYGTALGIIIMASEQGKRVKVLATETRPLLQGARLTTWELVRAGVPVTLITDSAAGYFLSRGEVSAIIVGADRIAANGDTANKIGTYTLAVLARENKVPFFVVVPTSTIDPSLATGEEIPVEQRGSQEITHIQGVPIAPEGCPAANPAFDVTPSKYITAIITEQGIIKPPFGEGLARLLELPC